MDWEQLELTTEFRQHIEQLKSWTSTAPTWPPFTKSRALFEAVEPRLKEMQAKLGRVLVVGLVGGSGVGKSTLVNALVVRPVCKTGHVRPTTSTPFVLCHTNIDPSFLGLGQEQVEVHCVDSPLLEEMMLVDCPDPDTQDRPSDHDNQQRAALADGSNPDARQRTGGANNRNLDILRHVLPHCDVILYVGSLEKYKDQLVQQEVIAHARGRSIAFVQNKADRDRNICDDWKTSVEHAGLNAPMFFYVDAADAFECERRGNKVPEEFERLRKWLREDIARARHRIKRANVLDLLNGFTHRTEAEIQRQMPAIATLKEKIDQERRKIFDQMQRHLHDQLNTSRSLWHQRLKKQLTRSWGGGLFIGLARISIGFDSVLNLLLRLSRAPRQMRLLAAGGMKVGRAVRNRSRQHQGGVSITAAELGVNEGDVVEARSVLQGFAIDAELWRPGLALDSSSASEQEATQLTVAGRQLFEQVQASLDLAVERQVKRSVGIATRLTFETLFIALLGYLLFLLGRNFFYDGPWLGKPLFELKFLVYSAVWVVAWGAFLHWLLMRKLCRGFGRELDALVMSLPGSAIVGVLYADLDSACDAVIAHANRLDAVSAGIDELHRRLGRVDDLGIGQMQSSLEGGKTGRSHSPSYLAPVPAKP